MTIGPLIQREMRMRARQGATYWSRCAAAGIGTFVAIQSNLAAANTMGMPTAGGVTYAALSWLGFLLACGSTLVTSDCISHERREGTLSLLFLTHLKVHEVVLAKLSAAGLAALCALIGFLPTLAIPLLSGGVSGAGVARTELALANALFVSLAAGIWVSARVQNRRKAMTKSLVLILVLNFVPWIIARAFWRFGAGAAYFTCASPYTAFHLSPEAAYVGASLQYWLALLIPHIAGWLLLLGATTYLLKNWRAAETSDLERPMPAEPAMVEEALVMAERRLALREQDPICWAVSRVRGHSALIWSGAFLLLLLGGTGFSIETVVVGSWLIPGGTGLWNGVNLLLNLGAGALLAWGAGRALFSAQRNGELELLLSTPLGARDIVDGHWRALCGPLRGGWLLVGLLVFLQFFVLPSPSNSDGILIPGLSVVQRLMIPVNVVLDIIAICWVGMWFGLRAHKPLGVMIWTVGLVIGLPWIVAYLVDIAFLVSAPTSGAATAGLGLLFWLIASGLLFLAKNIFFIRWAALKLRDELRASASLAMREWLH